MLTSILTLNDRSYLFIHWIYYYQYIVVSFINLLTIKEVVVYLNSKMIVFTMNKIVII